MAHGKACKVCVCVVQTWVCCTKRTDVVINEMHSEACVWGGVCGGGERVECT